MTPQSPQDGSGGAAGGDSGTETGVGATDAQRGAEWEFCTVKIFPIWANSWVRCGSAIGRDGECVQYGHRRGDK